MVTVLLDLPSQPPLCLTRLAGDLLDYPAIKMDAGERLVETSLVDLTCVSDPLDAGDQFIAGAEGKIVVKVLVASILIWVVSLR